MLWSPGTILPPLRSESGTPQGKGEKSSSVRDPVLHPASRFPVWGAERDEKLVPKAGERCDDRGHILFASTQNQVRSTN